MNSLRLIQTTTFACLLTGCSMFSEKVATTLPQETLLKPDPALHHALVEAARRKAAEAHWEENFVVASVMSYDWKMQREPATGVLVGRGIEAAVGSRTSDGQCGYKEMLFVQEHDGRGFTGPIEVSASGPSTPVQCSALRATE